MLTTLVLASKEVLHKTQIFYLNVMIILRSKIAGQSAQKLILQSPLPLLLPPFYKIQSDHIHQNKPNI